MLETNRRIRPAFYLLICACILCALPLSSFAQSAIVNTHKPFTLKVRYGANADPENATPPGSSKARRIETRVAELDTGRIETRDAILEYWVDATGDSGEIALSVDLTYAVAGGQAHTKTRMLLARRQWLRVSDTSQGATPADAVYVRIDPN